MKQDPTAPRPNDLVQMSETPTNAEAYEVLLHSVSVEVVTDDTVRAADQVRKACGERSKKGQGILLEVGVEGPCVAAKDDVKALFRELERLSKGRISDLSTKKGLHSTATKMRRMREEGKIPATRATW